MAPLPVEWMDPMSWRLPSGKALAEFALQSGFLWPLMLSGPNVKKKTPVAKSAAVEVPGQVAPDALPGAAIDKQKEPPGASGGFRETR